MSQNNLSGYETQAKILADRYESMDFATVHWWLLPFLPKTRGAALDVGAGLGRDAQGVRDQGFEVVAVEPSPQMREEGQKRHPDPGILWIDDALPELDSLVRRGLSFTLILLSAVWMHIPPADRSRAFRKLIFLLHPSGILALTLRQGPDEPDRPMFESSFGEIEHLARSHGLSVLNAGSEPDRLGRPEVTWHHVVLKFPDDETGTLPLLRHVILKSDKSSTYKLGLLRSVARIADGTQGMGRLLGDEKVSVPLGLVALYWIRLYKSLIAANLPQTPTNIGDKGLGFVRESWSRLHLSPLDLRPGLRFWGEDALVLNQAIRDAVETITKMPAHYLTFPGTKDPVFKARKQSCRPPKDTIVLDERYLRAFGEILLPLPLWKAMSRYDVWIEPALQSEWLRLMTSYQEGLGRDNDLRVMVEAMWWSDPRRDVPTARGLLERDRLYCVWSGKRLTEKTLDIDHCFSWAAWPCDDLWNLFPASGNVNRNKKDKLPSSRILRQASERMMEWWEAAYVKNGNHLLRRRFYVEAKGTLVMGSEGVSDFREKWDVLLKRFSRRSRSDGSLSGWIRGLRSGMAGDGLTRDPLFGPVTGWGGGRQGRVGQPSPLKRISAWVPSQKGLFCDAPQRQRVTRFRAS